MANRSIQVHGMEKVLENLRMLQDHIRTGIPAGLTNAVDRLRDDAIVNLQSKLGTSNPTYGPWGHSIYQKAIEDKASWIKTYPKWNEVVLTSTSPHSAIVELGGTKIVQANAYGHEAWPIGQNQGWNDANVIYKPTFKLQVGYHYLTTSMNNPTTLNGMLDEVGKILRITVRGIRS